MISDELDDQALNGDGNNDDLTGFFQRLDDPAAPDAGAADFDAFVTAFAGGIDGLWASRMNEVGIVCGPETYRLSAKTFRDAAGQDLGDMAFADYAMAKYGGWWTNKRMPATAGPHPAGHPPPPQGAAWGSGRRSARTGAGSASTTSTAASANGDAPFHVPRFAR